MTGKGATVIFDRSIRDDDAEPVLAALRMMKGVAAVHPSLDCGTDVLARARVRREVEKKLYKAIGEAFQDKES